MKITATLLSLAALTTCAVADDAAEPTNSPVPEGTCTAKLTTKLCNYDDSNLLAAAAGSRNGCWSLCDSEKYGPCNFVIFVPGNPHLGTGTCWLYPGDKFDSAKGTDQGCSSPYLEVYDKPSCTGGPAKPSVVCPAATGPSPVASPSPVAAVCGYEAPETCFETCYASSGSTDCLNLCAKADDCEFAIFNALNDLKSPWMSGNCWVFTKGKFDPTATKPCDGKPSQFVYNNVCPKPAKSTSTSNTSATPTPTGSNSNSPAASGSGSAASNSAAASKTGATSHTSTSASTSSTGAGTSSGSKPDSNVAAQVAKANGAAATGVSLGLIGAAALAFAL